MRSCRATSPRKAYLTIAVGCTGGRHRSVVVAGGAGRYFKERGQAVAVGTEISTVATSANDPFTATNVPVGRWPAG
jgi:hypothetical protein